VIRVTKLKVTNYRGIRSLEADLSKGAIAKGRNGSGKTSVLRAIGSALAASDIGADAVRIGEERGEILIDLDLAEKGALHVRRRFGPGGSELQITNADGDKKARPAALLADLLGTSPLDVIDVVLEKDKKKRRERILAALPVRVTVEQLRRWVPGLPENHDVTGHGLEVVERLRAGAYDRRTAANKAEKAAADDLARRKSAAEAARAAVPAGAGPLEDAERFHLEATHAANVLGAKRDAAARAGERMAGLRERAAALRALETQSRAEAAARPGDEVLQAAQIKLAEAGDVVEDLERRLIAARASREERLTAVGDIRAQQARASAAAGKADELAREAQSLEEGIATAVESVSDNDIAAAGRAVEDAALARRAAQQLAAADEADRACADAEKVHVAAKAEADRLDAVVRGLATEAPAAILAESKSIAVGLELDGDEVRLNGVSLDRLCGAEQMKFAADIAKALNPGVGFLVVDGLERLDPDQLDAFVAAATAGGRQLFGSLVDRGDLVLAAIEHTPDAAAAE
jgi:hypothetical protein